ncbi:hypothetical protein CLF_101461 [Clonorchis sinensis]|uniref:Uncharacterized protein n=1 Tax=Clonorchis sinensis TaxID=79923 RepID=G7Y5T2_CLOSI|nr:hypothetical protein CLF_101461 [Clonorchis sinensis]
MPNLLCDISRTVRKLTGRYFGQGLSCTIAKTYQTGARYQCNQFDGWNRTDNSVETTKTFKQALQHLLHRASDDNVRRGKLYAFYF